MGPRLRMAAIAALLISLTAAVVGSRWSEPETASAGVASHTDATGAHAIHALVSQDEDDDDDDDSGRGRGRGRGGDEDDDNGGDDEDDSVPVTGDIPADSLVIRILDDDAFTPSTLTVDPGQSVTFVNEHDDEHTATGSGFDTGVIPPGGTATVVLDEPGTFAFACNFHPEMTGTIGVRGPDGTVPPPAQASPPPADATAVEIVDFAFGPTSITVPVGTTVAWTNAGAAPHTVTAADASFDSGILDPGAAFSHTFTAPGTYAYQCALHPQMRGTVVVTGTADAAATGAATPATPATPAVPARQAFDAMNEVLATGDPNALDAVFAPDYVAHVAGDDQPSDLQVLKDRLTDLRDRVPDAAFRVDDLVDGGGDKAAVRYTLVTDTSGTPRAETNVAAEGIVILRGEDGRIVESWEAVAEAAPSAQDEATGATPVATPEDDLGGSAAPATVSIVDFAFDPPTLEIATGTTVTWTNDGVAPHTVTAEDGAFDSGQLAAGQTFSHTFDAPGSYPYRCDFHPDMTATIDVQ